MTRSSHPLAFSHLSQDSIHHLLVWCFMYAANHPQELQPDKWRELGNR